MQNQPHGEARLQSMRWIVDARWYYSLLAFFLGIIAQDGIGGPYALVIVFVSLVIVLLCNWVFLVAIKKIDTENLSEERLNTLNMAQIGVDMVFFFIVMMFTGGGVESIGHSFFFVPIVVSMIIFGFRGAISVAIAASFLVFLSVLLHSGIITGLLIGNTSLLFSHDLINVLLKSGVLSLLYVLTGFFGGYISRLLSARDKIFQEQITREEDQIDRLEKLSKGFDQSAKLLVRRDLELTSANEKLIQLDKMKSEIISVVAHQLRTPLSAIKWTLKILLDKDAGALTEQQQELLQKGFDSNERMIKLVNDMLSVDRLESGKIKYAFVPVQFEDLVQEMIQNLLTLATRKNIRIEFSSPKDLLPKIKVDVDKMRDVLQNLIDNAIKYTKKDGVILVGVAKEDDELHFWVKDNGIGIPPEEADKIFARFFRATNATHTETDGSGLGLFIAQSIVKRHGGRMWFESVLGEGSTFHVALPLNN